MGGIILLLFGGLNLGMTTEATPPDPTSRFLSTTGTTGRYVATTGSTGRYAATTGSNGRYTSDTTD